MQDNTPQNFDIFDLFFVIKKFKYKYIIFSILFFLIVVSINLLINNSKKELHIHIFIENDLFLPNKYNALSNFLMFSNNKVVMSNLQTKFDKLEYNSYFFKRHVYGFPKEILNNNQSLSNEFISFFNSSYVKGFDRSESILKILYAGNNINNIDQRFLNNLLDEINSRLHLSILELMSRINEDIKNLDKIIINNLKNSNFQYRANFFKDVYEQNIKTIQDFKESGAENYFILKEIKTIYHKKLSSRYYLSSILIYFFLVSLSSILLLGYEIKKRNVK